MITAKCEFCGKEFKKYPSSNKKYCSKECMLAARSKKVETKTFICEQCGKEFTRTLREVKNAMSKGQEIRFCSKKCKSDFWGKDRVEVTCPVCGKKFLQQKRLAHINLCCSPECSSKNPANRMLMGEEVTLTCQKCGKKFKKKKSYVEKQERRGQPVKFCSRECSGSAPLPPRPAVKCKNCGKEFIPRDDENIFCSGTCAAAYKNKDKHAMITCVHCHKEFMATRYQIDHGRKYCSMKCFNEDRALKKDSYKVLQHYLRSSQQYKKWRSSVMKRASWSCEDCGAHGKVKLNAHHKIELYSIAKKYDFKAQDILNSKEFNDVSNGECLCLDCHIKKHPYNTKLINLKGQFCRREFKTTKKLTTTRTELNGKTGEIRNPNRRH